MCRMIAVIGNKDFSPQPFIAALSDAAQNALHAPHQDGHGIVYNKHNDWGIHKEPTPVWETSFCHSQIATNVLMAHARKSSFGAITIENVHPFIDDTPKGSFAFMHNGTIYDASTVFPHVHFTEQMCDSRIYAQALAASVKENASFDSAVITIAQKIHNRSARYTSANAIIASRDALYCIRSCTIEEDYYTLFYAMTDSILLVSTDRFGTYDWTLIPNNSVIKCVFTATHRNVIELAHI